MHRPARPAQLDTMTADKLEGGLDPQKVSEMSHTTAQSLLHRVHESQDAQVVAKVLTLVETEGIDLIAELWSKSAPETLPGIMWRLYTLRMWMQKNRNAISKLWSLGEPAEGAASAITGVEEFPSAQDITDTADSILTGAFTGDFAVALDRASAFVDVIAAGMEIEAERKRKRYLTTGGAQASADAKKAAHDTMELMQSSASLARTAKEFHVGAELWRKGQLD
jgi:hypothetical protein